MLPDERPHVWTLVPADKLAKLDSRGQAIEILTHLIRTDFRFGPDGAILSPWHQHPTRVGLYLHQWWPGEPHPEPKPDPAKTDPEWFTKPAPPELEVRDMVPQIRRRRLAFIRANIARYTGGA